MKHVLTLLAVILFVLPVRAQSGGPDIAKYLGLISSGQADDVRREIPSLLSQYPNNPGVLYLQGLVTADGAEAVRIYQSIVDNFPRSEWADDALYRVYQYYYALGLYRTAELKLEQLKQDYPDSPVLPRAAPMPGDAKLPDTTAAQEPRAARTTDNPQQQFTLQVGAYTTQVNAEKQKLFFEDLGFPVDVGSKMKDNKSLFIVLVGSFGSAEEARAKADEIKQKYNITSLVVTK